MTGPLRSTLVAALVAAVCLAAAPAARADGDPASDILTKQDVYYGGGINLRSKAAAQLPALLEQSRRKGYDVKVALISTFEDLGVATFVWNEPKDYADYLGAELSIVYKQRVLVVMPNGYGIYHLGHSTARDGRVLERLPSPRTAGAFLPRAIDAVRKLAAGRGIELTVPDVDPPPGGIKQPQSHFAVGANEGNPKDVPPPPAATAAAPAVSTDDGGGAGALLFAAPILIGVAIAGVLIVRGRRRHPVEPRA